MDFAFSEEQEMLRRSARDFLTKECSSKVVRRLMEADDSYDAALWKKIAGLGWTALGIPESYGGVGTFLDLIVVLEEAGRALLPGPFFATMGLAVHRADRGGHRGAEEGGTRRDRVRRGTRDACPHRAGRPLGRNRHHPRGEARGRRLAAGRREAVRARRRARGLHRGRGSHARRG